MFDSRQVVRAVIIVLLTVKIDIPTRISHEIKETFKDILNYIKLPLYQYQKVQGNRTEIVRSNSETVNCVMVIY